MCGDELWLMYANERQQALWREMERHALKQRAQAYTPGRHRPWWQALSHVLIGCSVKLCPPWRLQPRQQTDELVQPPATFADMSHVPSLSGRG
jgi:hypothetical protein